jgi:hypothetical protein
MNPRVWKSRHTNPERGSSPRCSAETAATAQTAKASPGMFSRHTPRQKKSDAWPPKPKSKPSCSTYLIGGPSQRGGSIENAFVPDVRKYFNGPVIVGADQTVI